MDLLKIIVDNDNEILIDKNKLIDLGMSETKNWVSRCTSGKLDNKAFILSNRKDIKWEIGKYNDHIVLIPVRRFI